MLQNAGKHQDDLTVIWFPPAAILINIHEEEEEEVSSWDMQMTSTCVVVEARGILRPACIFLYLKQVNRIALSSLGPLTYIDPGEKNK